MPIVFTMRQPPVKVPSAIAVWAESTTHSGTSRSARARSRRDQQREDHAHRLLRVVGAVAEAVRAGRDELPAAEAAVEAFDPVVPVGATTCTPIMRTNESASPASGASTMNTAIVRSPSQTSTLKPAFATAAPDHAADERVRRRGREPEEERDEVPDDRADERGEDEADREHVLVDDVVGDRARRPGCRRRGTRRS